MPPKKITQFENKKVVCGRTNFKDLWEYPSTRPYGWTTITIRLATVRDSQPLVSYMIMLSFQSYKRKASCHVTAKWKQSILREVFEWPALLLETPWRQIVAFVGIIPIAKWLAKIKQRSDVGCRLCKRAWEQRGASTDNPLEEDYCSRGLSTWTVPSATEWRQPSRPRTTSSGDISIVQMCKLHKNRRVTSGLSHPAIMKVICTRCGKRKSLCTCSRESLTEKAAEIEKMISLIEHEESPMILTGQHFITMKIVSRIEGRMA